MSDRVDTEAVREGMDVAGWGVEELTNLAADLCDELDRTREALREHGHHNGSCPYSGVAWGAALAESRARCTCGLDAALAESGGHRAARDVPDVWEQGPCVLQQREGASQLGDLRRPLAFLRPGSRRTMSAPNPGSNEAIAAGCHCPVLDNCHGRYPPYGHDDEGRAIWIIAAGCPLHSRPLRATDTEGER